MKRTFILILVLQFIGLLGLGFFAVLKTKEADKYQEFATKESREARKQTQKTEETLIELEKALAELQRCCPNHY